MRLIVEGPDGCGKTTLIERLEHQLQIERQPRRVAKDMTHLVDLGEVIEADFEQENEAQAPLRLYDRYPLLSGSIYGPLLKGKLDDYLAHEARTPTLIYEFWALQENLIIYCLPAFEAMWYNLRNATDDQPEMDRATAQVLYNLYRTQYYDAKGRLWGMSSDVFLWDYEMAHDEDLYLWLKERLPKEYGDQLTLPL